MATAGTCFVNVEEAVLEWAWHQYDDTATRRQRLLREKDRKNQQKYLRALIDWTDVRSAMIIWKRVQSNLEKSGIALRSYSPGGRSLSLHVLALRFEPKFHPLGRSGTPI